MQTENDTSNPEDSAQQEAREGCSGATCSALAILQGCGLHGRYYDNIENAAEGVRDIIRSLRADLHDPPHDIQCAVLRKLGVEGFTKEGVAPTHQLIPMPNNKNMQNNNDITPGQDKFLPVNLDEQMRYKPDPLLRYQIEEISFPPRQSSHLPPANDASGRIAASLTVALLILATTAVIVHCSR